MQRLWTKSQHYWVCVCGGGGGGIRSSGPPNFHFTHYFTPKLPLSTILYPLISTFHNFDTPNFHFPHFKGQISISWLNWYIFVCRVNGLFVGWAELDGCVNKRNIYFELEHGKWDPLRGEVISYKPSQVHTIGWVVRHTYLVIQPSNSATFHNINF